MLVCTACNAATRTGARNLPDGSKERFCKKCGAGIGQIAPPK
jgi:large subunit ribosomal protein L24